MNKILRSIPLHSEVFEVGVGRVSFDLEVDKIQQVVDVEVNNYTRTRNILYTDLYRLQIYKVTTGWIFKKRQLVYETKADVSKTTNTEMIDEGRIKVERLIKEQLDRMRS